MRISQRVSVRASMVFFFIVSWIAATCLLQAQEPRAADVIVKEFRSVHMPTMSRGNTPEAVRAFKNAIESGCKKQAQLAWELYSSYPDHQAVPGFLATRWAGMNNALRDSKAVLDETLALLKKEKRSPIRDKAVLAACRATLLMDDVPVERKLRYAHAACDVVPSSEGGPLALIDIAKYHLTDVSKMKELCQKVVKGWPKSQWAAPEAKGFLKRLERVGQTLEINEKDILGSGAISSLKKAGKPYIVMVYSGFFETLEKELAQIKSTKANTAIDLISIYNFRHKEGPGKLAKLLIEKGVHWPHAYTYKKGDSPWKGKWSTGEVPLYYLVGGDGKVRALSHRFSNVKKLYLEKSGRKKKSL